MTIASPRDGACQDCLPDLDTRRGIHDLVVDFYREIVFDDLLGPVFEEVAEVDWTTHIPKLIDYWCRVLLRQPGYDGYVLDAHRQIHVIEPLRSEHFDRWYRLFVESVDRCAQGPIAEQAKTHAATMAAVLARRLLDTEWTADARNPTVRPTLEEFASSPRSTAAIDRGAKAPTQ
jgi:hemoglobin